jgi:DNA-binding MarR family transcriptional regulator
MSAPDLTERVLRALRRILRKTSEHSRQVFRETGLTVPQALCLRAIGDRSPENEATVVQVSRTVQLAPATVSRILDRIEAAGLIQRQRSSQDRRKVCLVLTELGQERLLNLPAPLQERFVGRLLALEPSRQQQLLDALEQVVELMEASGLAAAPVLEPEFDVGTPLEDPDSQPTAGP